MIDTTDIVQRRDDADTDTAASGVVDVGARAPKQDLWDVDDDIFKPLLERVEEERRQEEMEAAAQRALDQSEKLIGDNYNIGHGIGSTAGNNSGIVDRFDDFSLSPLDSPSKMVQQRRSVLTNPSPGSVTIRSQLPTMPRVVWQKNASPFKKISAAVEAFNQRVQLTFAGVGIFIMWNVVALLCARFASLMFFQFDPFYPRNWQMLYKLYNQGSTFQWNFVLFYMIMFVAVPLFGIGLATRGAAEFRKFTDALLKPVLAVPRAITRFLLIVMGIEQPKKELIIPRAAYAQPGTPKGAYHGATFKKEKTDDDETGGGSVGGAGAGGGHGKPSWQMGPANTQAFPRAEQGRR